VLLAAAAAPWVAGANTSLPLKGWWLGAPLAAAFFLLLLQRFRARAFPPLPRPVIISVLFLVGCIGWWASRPEIDFPTKFSAEHWRFLEATFPFAILQWPRLAYLSFIACGLLGFLATLDLGASPEFRRALCQVIGLSGLTFALYALGIKWLGWSTPPWIDLANDTEQFNVVYFHHNFSGASLNLAWPLLIFGSGAFGGRLLRWKHLLLLGVVAAVLPLWHSRAPQAIAVGLLLGGALWQVVPLGSPRQRARSLTAAIIALFLGVSSWQGWSISKTQTSYPDQWLGAARTQLDAAVRDAVIKAAALKRGDRLVASPAPPRATAWLAAVRMAKDYPYIGLGPGAWLKRGALYSNDTLVNTFYQHRQFVYHDLLQTAAEWGGLAALAWLVIWIGAFWQEIHRVSETPSKPGLLLALIGIALHSMVHFPLQNPALLLWTLLLLGLAWNPLVSGQHKSPSNTPTAG
jgi:hypothetical protein